MNELLEGYMNKRRNEETAPRRGRRRQGQKTNTTAFEMGRGGGGERAVSGVAHARDEYGSIHCQEGRPKEREGRRRENARIGGASSGRRLLTNEPLTHSSISYDPLMVGLREPWVYIA